jgi:hypothetical protein
VQRPKAALKVELPSKKDEPLKLGRVGLIALAGFAIGIVWPHLAGVRLVPTLPSESLPAVHPSALQTSFDKAPGFFICNTYTLA